MSAYDDYVDLEDDYTDDCDWDYFDWCEEQRELELDAAGTTDEPKRDEQFNRYEGECECGLRSVVLDLLGIKWSLERVLAVVQQVAKDAA